MQHKGRSTNRDAPPCRRVPVPEGPRDHGAAELYKGVPLARYKRLQRICLVARRQEFLPASRLAARAPLARLGFHPAGQGLRLLPARTTDLIILAVGQPFIKQMLEMP